MVIVQAPSYEYCDSLLIQNAVTAYSSQEKMQMLRGAAIGAALVLGLTLIGIGIEGFAATARDPSLAKGIISADWCRRLNEVIKPAGTLSVGFVVTIGAIGMYRHQQKKITQSADLKE